MMLRVESSIGTARPSPTPATAVLIPITLARPSASAPPEFPGFSAASVCTTFSTTRPARTGSARPSALTTPAVTEPVNPIGLPIATTSWPTRRRDASPSSADTKPLPWRRSTARSDSWSRPIDVERDLTPVDERSRAAVDPVDDVRGGEREPVGRDDDGGTRSLDARTADPLTHTEARDRGDQPFRDRGDDGRVRVERLVAGVEALVHTHLVPQNGSNVGRIPADTP